MLSGLSALLQSGFEPFRGWNESRILIPELTYQLGHKRFSQPFLPPQMGCHVGNNSVRLVGRQFQQPLGDLIRRIAVLERGDHPAGETAKVFNQNQPKTDSDSPYFTNIQ